MLEIAPGRNNFVAHDTVAGFVACMLGIGAARIESSSKPSTFLQQPSGAENSSPKPRPIELGAGIQISYSPDTLYAADVNGC